MNIIIYVYIHISTCSKTHVFRGNAWHGDADGWYSLVVLTKRMDVTKVLTLIVPSNKAKSLEETPGLQKTMRCFGILHQCLLVLSAVT